MGTAHWHTAVRHIPPSGYVPARGYRPILCSHTPVSRIPESCSRSSLRNGISTVRSDCDGSFPHAAPFLPPIHNICDRNAPPPGFLHSTSGPSLFHTEIHPFLFSSFWNFVLFDLLKKRWIFIQISTFSVRFFFLFYSTCDTFCEALLEAEENDCCRDRTDEYAEHQHAIIYSVAAEQVRYQHRHGNGIIVL